MLVYEVEFLKKTGEKRKMKFVKTKDLPPDFLLEHVVGDPQKHRSKGLQDGMEVVWDLEKRDFRIVNWKSLVKPPTVVDETVELN